MDSQESRHLSGDGTPRVLIVEPVFGFVHPYTYVRVKLTGYPRNPDSIRVPLVSLDVLSSITVQ